MGNRVRHPVQFVAREYLRLLWADSDWQADWQRVRRGEMEFLQFERKWKLPRPLRRILIDACSEPEEPSLQRLLEKIPVIEVSGYVVLSPSGVKVEPELPPKPLRSLPEAEPSVETREEYLQRVRWVLARELDYERHFEGIQRWVEAIPDEARREAYSQALRERAPRLLPEFREKHGTLPSDLEEQVVLELAKRYYEACLQAVQGVFTPKRHRNRQLEAQYLRFAAECYYLRMAKGWSWGQIALKLRTSRQRVQHAVERVAEMIEIPSDDPQKVSNLDFPP